MKWGGKIGHYAALLIAVPLAFELFFLGWLLNRLEKAERLTENGLRAEKILQHSQLLSTSLLNSFVAVANYGFYRSDRFESDKQFAINREALVKEMATFKQLLAMDHRFDSRLSELDEFVSRAQSDLEGTRKLFKDGKEEEALTRSLNWRNDVGSYYSILTDVTRTYRQIKEDDERVQPVMEKSLVTTLFAGVAASVALALGLAYLVSTNVLRDLSCLTENLERLGKRQPLLPPPAGVEEITELNRSLCRTADALFESERQLTFSRARWDAILSCSPDGIAGIDCSNRILFVNQAVTDLSGWTPDALIEADFSRLLPTVVSDSQARAVETLARGADGRDLPVEVCISELTDNGRVVSLRDIQQRHAIKSAKKEFSTNLRADLESPLNFIKNACLEVADLAECSETVKIKLVQTTTSCSRLLALVNQLDSAVLASAEIYVTHRKLVNIHELLSACVATMYDFASNANVGLHCFTTTAASPGSSALCEAPWTQCSDSSAAGRRMAALPVRADIDEPNFSRVITNLISNAIKFSPPGSAVSILWTTNSKDLEILVRDTGRGIPTDKISTLFDRFSQISDEDRKSGSGLGLAICRQIIEAHDGTIEVESAEGKGTTFRITIPNCVEVE